MWPKRFLEPLGVCQVRYVGHPQPLTLPKYIKGVKNVIIKGALIPDWVDELIKEQRDAGFLGLEPVEVKGVQVTPYDLALKLWETIPEGRDRGPQSSGLKVIVKGKRSGAEVVYHRRHGGQNGARDRPSRVDRLADDGRGRCESNRGCGPRGLHRPG